MDLFGLKAHEEQHAETARVLRRLVEQVSQLTINLGQTRVEQRRLTLRVDGKVDTEDVDPVILGINQALADARVKLTEVAAAAEDQWNDLSDELEDAIEDVNQKTETLPEE
ncbi:MAG: hypothetical protein ACR2N9_11615 [Acidimicrobiia bacterium]